jgi:hypothetical protein
LKRKEKNKTKIRKNDCKLMYLFPLLFSPLLSSP